MKQICPEMYRILLSVLPSTYIYCPLTNMHEIKNEKYI